MAQRERPTGSETATVRYQHTDAQGTPIATTDAGKAIVDRFEYEPYGQLVNATLRDGPGYTGHVQDAATGLTYMQQRYYDSGIGLFLSVDPVTALSNPVGMFNRYRYANDNPYRFFDPDGRLGCTGSRLQSVCDAGGLPYSGAGHFTNGGVKSQPRHKIGPVKEGPGSTRPTAPENDRRSIVRTTEFKPLLEKGTIQVGLNLSGAAGPLALTVTGGVALDTRGNVAAYTDSGGGGGGAGNADFSLTVQFSNARSVNELTGVNYNTSLDGGAVVHGSIEGSISASPTMDGRIIGGGGFSIGPGAGGGVTVTETYTTVYPFIGDGN